MRENTCETDARSNDSLRVKITMYLNTKRLVLFFTFLCTTIVIHLMYNKFDVYDSYVLLHLTYYVTLYSFNSTL